MTRLNEPPGFYSLVQSPLEPQCCCRLVLALCPQGVPWNGITGRAVRDGDWEQWGIYGRTFGRHPVNPKSQNGKPRRAETRELRRAVAGWGNPPTMPRENKLLRRFCAY
jgi:hypothetical protein